MAATPGPGGPDIWYMDDLGGSTESNPMMRSSKKLTFQRQTGNTVAGNVSNSGIGTAACPALAAGAVGTVTISDSLIATTSIIFCQVRRGTTTPAAGAYCMVQDVMTPTAGSVVVNVVNLGTAPTLSTDTQLWYWVLN